MNQEATSRRERRPAHVPASTYRVQFHRGFTFLDAERIVPYLSALGVGDCYCSPYLMARRGSPHGYDIADHTRLNAEVGSESDYRQFVEALRSRSMGQLLDFVPNHMGIDPMANRWWRDVLENGPSSLYGRFFDIDWHPVKPELNGKVLLPILGDQYGTVLERGEIRLGFGDGRLHVDYFDHCLPVNPRHATTVFEYGIEGLTREMGEQNTDLREFLSILTALNHLPDYLETDPGRIAERHREKEVASERLARLVEHSGRIRAHIEKAVSVFNGEPGRAESFDLLHRLLEQQAYRLAYWRTAAHEINYRRFFDINDLAGIRMEDPEVFAATHSLVHRLVKEHAVNGLRIDHPDGLYDPDEYFRRLQDMAAGEDGPQRPLYIVAEKILSADESLPCEWPIEGTTGYNFVNELNGLFVDPASAKPLRRIYRRVTGQMTSWDDVVYQCKKLITRTSLASELNVLAHALNGISEGNRKSRDFTLNSLREVLGEIVACFPVYRTYVNARGWTPSDRRVIETAVRRARRRNPALEPSAWDFLREVLLPRPVGDQNGTGENSVEPDSAYPSADEREAVGVERRAGYPPPDAKEYQQRLNFVMRFQQYTAPVQAKGVEDTAFYRYNMLVSLNEVGGDPGRFGRTAAEFHASNMGRLEKWPFEMIATCTHDTKLGEDVRARIDAISELVDDWRRALARWMRVNAANRTKVEGEPAPDRNDEYRFYQVLLGTWPAEDFRSPAPDPMSVRVSQSYVNRLRDYMTKAIKEAKVRTSWINDNEAYDAAVAHFVERSLAGPTSPKFLNAFLPFARRVAFAGMHTSLAQLVLKMASPGIPDFYQGTEFWDLRMVDPDNRGPVDYERRSGVLARFAPWLERIDRLCGDPSAVSAGDEPRGQAAAVADMVMNWTDGRIKLFVTAVGLHLRRAFPEVFLDGVYEALPVDVAGTAGNAVAFVRSSDTATLVVVAPRLFGKMLDKEQKISEVVGDARVALPERRAGRYANLLTGETIETRSNGTEASIRLTDALSTCPVALLWKI